MTRQYSRRTVLTAAAGAVGASAVPSLIDGVKSAEGPVILSGAIMGTTYRVTVPRLPSGLSARMIGHMLRDTLEQVDATMSTYRSDSEVSRLNRAVANRWIPVSARTFEVAAAALAMARLTGGAFDPTIGPLVDLWGFGPPGPTLRIPTAGAVAIRRRQIGHAGLEGRRVPQALRKQRDGLRVDFSGIAEGFAVDELAVILNRIGVIDFLVELGGEVRCQRGSPAGRPWTIAIEAPDPIARKPQAYVELKNGAIATSGDYRKFFIVGGRRHSHVIDPRTGYPVEHGLASVTVIHRSAMQADVLSTALLVLGPEAGFAFAERHQIAALFITRRSTGFSEALTTSFNQYLKGRPG